ncbi:hypothetical protein HOLleu_06048 [Holothuria leucospilota]|uniref:EamA domain-containing protein n=1 Tax=Holothuria leucospilota TaxID=206669 RepID=A0A9Q1CKQ1_HOLLE|nr:hypothetical protein HOLleu_06048 [Holothuria leucospilota]
MLGVQLSTVKAITSVSPYQIMFCRSFPFLLSLPFISWNDSLNYEKVDLGLYYFHAVSNSAALLLAYVAVEFAKLGNVSAICSNFPVPSAILGYLILSEPLTHCDVVVICVNFVGILLVSKPSIVSHSNEYVPETSQEFVGAVLALLSLLLYSLSAVAARKIAHRNNSDPLLMSFLPGMSGIIISGTISIITEMWNFSPTFEELFMCLLVGIFSLLGNASCVMGLKYESVSTVSVFVTLSTPVAFLFGILWLGQVPDESGIAGATLILGSTFCFLWSHAI